MTPVVRVKPGVKFDRIAPAGFVLLGTIARLPAIIKKDVWITCGTEAHPTGNPHTRGEAFDIGVTDMSADDIEDVLKEFYLLGPKFYAQYEVKTRPSDPTLAQLCVVNPEASGPHIHAQVARGQQYPQPDTLRKV